MKSIHANLVSNRSIFEAVISFEDKIVNIKKISAKENPELQYLLPGFIDLHIHGGGGTDIMDLSDPSIILKAHAKHGTTSLLLTTVTSSHIDLLNTFKKIENKKQNKNKGESVILGIHLEGPYINKEKLGAQPDFVRFFNEAEIIELHNTSKIKIITLAPELTETELIKKLKQQNIVVQIGHSNATYEKCTKAMNSGATSFTHLFNAMSAFHHRAPGAVGAALAHSNYAELIPDLLHVHPGAIKMALRSIPNLYFVTDATSATGMPDGNYKLGNHSVSKCSNGVRLSDGTLAGSALTTIEAFKNLTSSEIGLSIEEASYRLSTIQSEILGIDKERGSIDIGKYSDFILLNRNFSIDEVLIEGEKVGN